MSGIIGIINHIRRPVDEVVLKKMTDTLIFRGPDSLNTWARGPAGFGHTLLRTTEESRSEKQPCSLNNHSWIVADARIDGRQKLLDRLELNQNTVGRQITDPELILYAFQKWGRQCVEHMMGDFSFAVWDTEKQELFCARDHFGVKPFYFAQAPGSLVFSNSLNTLRTHPDISDKLNERAVFSFLLHGFNPDLNSTMFSQIHRLPPAHALLYDPEKGIRIRRYWEMPLHDTLRYRQEMDYVDHFRDLFQKTVNDRLRTRRIGVFMSGGLDSTSITATARDLLLKKYNRIDLRAFTCVYNKLITDDEKHYSSQVGSALRIPVTHIGLDEDRPYDDTVPIDHATPEPVSEPMITRSMKNIHEITRPLRVGLTGHGGDPLLHPAPHSFTTCFNPLKSWQWLWSICHYRLTRGRFPAIGFRTHMRNKLKRRHRFQAPPFPPWIKIETGRQVYEQDIPGWHERFDPGHPRSKAHDYILSPIWVNLFENSDPGVTQRPVEIRHPFFDLRLVSYLLSLPPIPWCVDKMILRKAMKKRLPGSILTRPKTPLKGFPGFESIRLDSMRVLDGLNSVPMISKYIDMDLFLNIARQPQQLRPEEYELITRPIGLALWLDQYTGENQTI